MRPALLAGLTGVILAAAAMLFALPADLLGRVPPPVGTISAPPQQVAVVDGETLLLHETVIRLHGVAAPLRGQSCRAGDGSATDCGAASAEALASLVRGHDVACRLDGRDGQGFVQGQCKAAGQELNRALVAAGWARSEVPEFAPEERAARAAGRGLWRSGTF